MSSVCLEALWGFESLLLLPQNQYRSDLNWMKGVSWDSDGCMNITQAKKAGELLSDVSMTMGSNLHF